MKAPQKQTVSCLVKSEMLDTSFSEYHSVDFESCLAIFDSNSPNYFSSAEKQEFEAFLLDLPGPYLIVKHQKFGIVGCGGYAFNQKYKSADLCWGMVHSDFHKQGFGDALLQYRLACIKANPEIKAINLKTSQLTNHFFQKVDFETLNVVKDGFASGLHRYDMQLYLHD